METLKSLKPSGSVITGVILGVVAAGLLMRFLPNAPLIKQAKEGFTASK